MEQQTILHKWYLIQLTIQKREQNWFIRYEYTVLTSFINVSVAIKSDGLTKQLSSTDKIGTIAIHLAFGNVLYIGNDLLNHTLHQCYVKKIFTVKFLSILANNLLCSMSIGQFKRIEKQLLIRAKPGSLP